MIYKILQSLNFVILNIWKYLHMENSNHVFWQLKHIKLQKCKKQLKKDKNNLIIIHLKRKYIV